MWDGKIAMIPIGEVEYQQRTTVARQAGERVWKNKAVTSTVYRELLLEVAEAIISKWPNSDWQHHPKIKIQQDGAGSHVADNDPLWLEGLTALGVAEKIELVTQPSQSPDLNICDLGLFNAIQAAYRKEAPRGSFNIIDCVERAYEQYPANKINRMWLSHQGVMNQIFITNGDNDFEAPHMNKERLERLGQLPVVLDVVPAGRLHHQGVVDSDSDDEE